MTTFRKLSLVIYCHCVLKETDTLGLLMLAELASEAFGLSQLCSAIFCAVAQ